VRVLNELLGVGFGFEALLGVALGVLAVVVWLVGLILCLTIILIPLRAPVMKLGSRLLNLAGELMHPL
jgi:Na+-transporting NADH:ubiquinone oxidoreductase subunit NqrB